MTHAPDAKRLAVGRLDMYLDARHFVDAQDGVVGEVRLLDATAFECDLFVERGG